MYGKIVCGWVIICVNAFAKRDRESDMVEAYFKDEAVNIWSWDGNWWKQPLKGWKLLRIPFDFVNNGDLLPIEVHELTNITIFGVIDIQYLKWKKEDRPFLTTIWFIQRKTAFWKSVVPFFNVYSLPFFHSSFESTTL